MQINESSFKKVWITPDSTTIEMRPGEYHVDWVENNIHRISQSIPRVGKLYSEIDHGDPGSYNDAINEIFDEMYRNGWVRVTPSEMNQFVIFTAWSFSDKSKKLILDYLPEIISSHGDNVPITVNINGGGNRWIPAIRKESIFSVLAGDLLEVSMKSKFSSMVSSLVERDDEPRRKTATKTKIPPAKPVKDRPITPEIVFATPDDNAKMARTVNQKVSQKDQPKAKAKQKTTSRVMDTPPEHIKGPAANARAEFMRHGRSMASILNDQDLIDSLMDEDEADLLAAGFTAAEVRTLVNAMDTEVPITPDGELPEPVVPQDLPAVIEREMIYTGGRAHPKWYQVKRLPGYMQQAIRLIGRKVFKSFTYTPIEEIHVLSTLTNTESELQLTASWIQKHGNKVVHQKLEFQELIPDYEADMEVWDVSGYQFALVKDFMGLYIYGWVPKSGKYWDPRTKKYLK